jgi:general stress protein 26
MATATSKNMKKVAELMRELDFCMFTTFTADGGMYARPMSNNRKVEFDGDVWFFSGADTRKVAEIEANPHVHLSYADPKTFVFISMAGKVKIVKDKAKKRELWDKELERWFEDGPDGDDVVLLKVRPETVAYWTKEGDDTLTLE